MQHENLSRFVGACVEPKTICIVQEYCSKGSLEVSGCYSSICWYDVDL